MRVYVKGICEIVRGNRVRSASVRGEKNKLKLNHREHRGKVTKSQVIQR